MPKPIKFNYQKKAAFRDASYFIIVCEGQNREPDYFRFFEGLSSRVNIIPINASNNQSSPSKLIEPALDKEIELGANVDTDKVWFVIDTDKWNAQIHALRAECAKHKNWSVAQSNPCFEVWLYFHALNKLPELDRIDLCNNWKPLLSNSIKGGFNSDFHCAAIETAIENAKENYVGDGYSPAVGSTQLWQLAEQLIPLIKKDLDRIKDNFPRPVVLK